MVEIGPAVKAEPGKVKDNRVKAVIYKSKYDEKVSAKALFEGQTVKVDPLTLYSAARIQFCCTLPSRCIIN